MKVPRDLTGQELAKRLSHFGYQVSRQDSRNVPFSLASTAAATTVRAMWSCAGTVAARGGIVNRDQVRWG